jgi:DNA-binding response OmpR family regulator
MIVWSASAHATSPLARPVVMIVDDEPEIRDLEAYVLKQAGFAVLPVGSPSSAVRLVEAEMPVDLVIADLNMPGMNGDEMATRLRRLRPDLKILFVTAFIDDLFDAQGLLWANEAYLDKPFTRDGLVEAVSLLLCGQVTH